MQQFEWVHAAWLGMAIVLEIIANVFLKFSDGFRRKLYGILSLVAVLAAFSALSQAVKGIDLSVAYALWGGFWYRRDAGCRMDTVRATSES